MIKCDKGIGKIEGTGGQVLAEYGVLTRAIAKALVKNGVTQAEAEKEILRNAKLGLKGEKELKKMAAKKIAREIMQAITGEDEDDEGDY